MRRLVIMALAVFAWCSWTWPEVALIGAVVILLWLVVDAVRRAPITIPAAPLSGPMTWREWWKRRAARKALRRSINRPTRSLSERLP